MEISIQLYCRASVLLFGQNQAVFHLMRMSRHEQKEYFAGTAISTNPAGLQHLQSFPQNIMVGQKAREDTPRSQLI